jgi:Trk K+ transport system NAD-binding subunit
MKLFFSQLAFFFNQSRERNIRILLKFLGLLAALVALYSVLFHFLMMREGQQYTWITGLYWTLTVMSTLGFGDITFHTDLGRLFSILVLMSGMVFLLIMLPFTFIQFFYAPWLEAQARSRAPRRLPEETRDHVILTNFDPFTRHLIKRLVKHNYDYALVIDDPQRALEFYDENYRVVVGDPGDPKTYRNLRVDRAALVVASSGDMLNTNIAATVREVSRRVTVVTTADNADSVDILQLAGATHTFQFRKLLGEALARKTLGIRIRDNVVGAIDSLLVAETPVMGTTLAGKSLTESRLRETTGLNLIGLWEESRYIAPHPDARLDAKKVLLLAGSESQLALFDRHFVARPTLQGRVLILGGGRVGKAAAKSLEAHGIAYRIIERNRRLVGADDRYILGSGADIDTLNRAGIAEAPSIIITTHDDHTNIYLTIYCRKLRPDIQIISRANTERSLHKLHSVGADQVMSYASLAAGIIVNLLRPHGLQILAEGLNLFRQPVFSQFEGKQLADCRIRSLSGCNLVAVNSGDKMYINPEPPYRFSPDDELFLVGSDEAQRRYLEVFPRSTGRKDR